MKRSSERILVTHAGSLARPEDLIGDVVTFMAFPIPGATASAQRHNRLVAPPGTLTLAAHPMGLPAASRSALTTSPIDTLSPLAPDTA